MSPLPNTLPHVSPQFSPLEAGPDLPESGYDIPELAVGAEPAEPRQDCITAFLVIITDDGKALATSDIVEKLPTINIKRPATIEDMRRASHEIIDDIGCALQTQHLVNTQMQIAQQAARQQQAQQLLDGAVDLSQFKGRK